MLLLDQNTTEVCISSITYYLRIYVLMSICGYIHVKWDLYHGQTMIIIVQQGITQSTAEVFKMRI